MPCEKITMDSERRMLASISHEDEIIVWDLDGTPEEEAEEDREGEESDEKDSDDEKDSSDEETRVVPEKKKRRKLKNRDESGENLVNRDFFADLD